MKIGETEKKSWRYGFSLLAAHIHFGSFQDHIDAKIFNFFFKLVHLFDLFIWKIFLIKKLCLTNFYKVLLMHF